MNNNFIKFKTRVKFTFLTLQGYEQSYILNQRDNFLFLNRAESCILDFHTKEPYEENLDAVEETEEPSYEETLDDARMVEEAEAAEEVELQSENAYASQFSS